MHVGLAIETDREVRDKTKFLTQISDSLSDYFSNKSYGDGVQYLTIGYIATRVRPGFEEFSKERPPKFKAVEKVRLLDGSVKELTNSFTYDIKLSTEAYNVFLAVNGEDLRTFVIETLIDGLSKFDMLPKKVKNFDSVQFKRDFSSFLNSF